MLLASVEVREAIPDLGVTLDVFDAELAGIPRFRGAAVAVLRRLFGAPTFEADGDFGSDFAGLAIFVSDGSTAGDGASGVGSVEAAGGAAVGGTSLSAMMDGQMIRDESIN